MRKPPLPSRRAKRKRKPMNHNMILGGICSALGVLVGISGFLTEQNTLTPAVILFVAILYFAGRDMDQKNNENP